jgi:Bacterial SH3 domain
MEGHAIGRAARHIALRLIIVAAGLLPLAYSANAPAQVSRGFPSELPNATIVSDETSAARQPQPAADEGAPPAAVASLRVPHSHPRHYVTVSEPSYSAAVEPAHATLKLKQDAWAYAGPETSSRPLESIPAGKSLNVTGSTHYFVQVKLKNGATGYVPIAAVELTRPEDKIMRLSSNAAVLSQPNRYGKKLSEVHQGHDIHAIGVSMNYIKIRMKSGLEGYVPMTVAE